MADSIKFKRGAKAKLPKLDYGEPAFVSDEKELYIGTESGNIKLTSRSEIEDLETKNNELSSQLEDMAEYLNYMPINGGTFENIDGNENNNVIIDGGVY